MQLPREQPWLFMVTGNDAQKSTSVPADVAVLTFAGVLVASAYVVFSVRREEVRNAGCRDWHLYVIQTSQTSLARWLLTVGTP